MAVKSRACVVSGATVRAASFIHFGFEHVPLAVLQGVAYSLFLATEDRPVVVVEVLDDLKCPASSDDVAAHQFGVQPLCVIVVATGLESADCVAEQQVRVSDQLVQLVQVTSGSLDTFQGLGNLADRSNGLVVGAGRSSVTEVREIVFTGHRCGITAPDCFQTAEPGVCASTTGQDCRSVELCPALSRWHAPCGTFRQNVAAGAIFGHRRIMIGDVARLGLAVRDRRTRLGLSQAGLWKTGGPSNSTLTNIENGRAVPVSAITLRKLDTALRWRTGSAYTLLYGEESRTPISLPGATLHAQDLAAAAAQARRALELFDEKRIDFRQLEARVLLLVTEAEGAAAGARAADNSS